jgi:hypothetical protein
MISDVTSGNWYMKPAGTRECRRVRDLALIKQQKIKKRKSFIRSIFVIGEYTGTTISSKYLTTIISATLEFLPSFLQPYQISSLEN